MSCGPAPFFGPDNIRRVRVIDGDTIRILQQKPDVRLVGFNAPETRRAICEAERELGNVTKLLADFAILCNRANLISNLSLVHVPQEKQERHPAITEGVAALSKQMAVTSVLS